MKSGRVEGRNLLMEAPSVLLSSKGCFKCCMVLSGAHGAICYGAAICHVFLRTPLMRCWVLARLVTMKPFFRPTAIPDMVRCVMSEEYAGVL